MDLNHFPIGLPEIIILVVVVALVYFGFRALAKD